MNLWYRQEEIKFLSVFLYIGKPRIMYEPFCYMKHFAWMI